MKTFVMVVCGFFGLVFAGVLITGCTALQARSTVISQEQGYQARWADVQSQYQRRMDLLGNLSNAVKGYVKEESEVWKRFADARTQAETAGTDPTLATNPEKQTSFLKAQENLSVRINAVKEAYPALKSDVMFVRYMDEVAGTENRINVARERYTKSIEDYNNTVGMWAQFFGYKTVQYYKADNEAQKAPSVSF